MELTREELAIKDGKQGEAAQFAFGLLERIGHMMGAKRFQKIDAAYVNTCFAGAPSHVDFLEWITARNAKVAVPTFTNVGGWDARNPDIRIGEEGVQARKDTQALMQMHRDAGISLTMTCAPYQLNNAPKLGAQVVCSESNAVSYFNSVVGARTAKYGDYVDLAAALVGRVPHCGLHTDEGRQARLVLNVAELPEDLARDDLCYQLIGHVMGRKAGADIPVLIGMPASAQPESLRSVCAAGASAGGVAMYHAVGLTPEAPDLDSATGGWDCPSQEITLPDLAFARSELTQFESGTINAVALGTPHASLSEVEEAAMLLDGRRLAEGVSLFIQLNRFVLEIATQRGFKDTLEHAGVTLVTDTCLYWRPSTAGLNGRVMTNSAKFAYYAPGELRIACCIGSLRECVESAVRGKVWTDPRLVLS